MHVFYTPDISSDHYVLNEEESRHCAKVLRLGIGSVVYLVDGIGGLYEAQIESETKRNVHLRITKSTKEYQKRQHHLHLAVAPTKNIDRFEWFLEKATELGIDEITPIICDRSERKQIKEDRLQKVITAAVKQSLQAYHPVLNPLVSFSDFLERNTQLVESPTRTSFKFIAHCMEGAPKPYITELAKEQQQYTILIGPEGDFSPGELQESLAHGYASVSLGNTRLRTETAALAACFEISQLNR